MPLARSCKSRVRETGSLPAHWVCLRLAQGFRYEHSRLCGAGLAAGQLPSLPTTFTHTDYRVTIEVSEDASAETENAVSVKVIGTGGSTQQDVSRSLEGSMPNCSSNRSANRYGLRRANSRSEARSGRKSCRCRQTSRWTQTRRLNGRTTVRCCYSVALSQKGDVLLTQSLCRCGCGESEAVHRQR
jgi:hypothetical protein